ncbi:MAG: hypothetical protein V3V00_13025 [Saprospiraceae bacterium]
MYSLLAKRGQMFAILLGVIVVVIFLGSVIGGLSSAGYNMGTDLNQVLKNDPNQSFSFFDIGLQLTMALALIAAVLALLFGLYQMLTNIKGSLTGIISLLAIGAIFFGFYSSASDDLTGPISHVLQQFDISSGISKFITGSLWTTILMAVVAAAAMIILEIWNMFK